MRAPVWLSLSAGVLGQAWLACGGTGAALGPADAPMAMADAAMPKVDATAATDATTTDATTTDATTPDALPDTALRVVYVASAGYDPRATNAIYRFTLDPTTGALTPRGAPVPAGGNPSYLAVDAARRHLYAVNESAMSVASFVIDPANGALTLLNRVPSGGAAPTHLSLDAQNKFVLVANYSGSNATVLALNSDGSLGGIVASRTFNAGANTHCARVDPSNRFAFVVNEGADTIAHLAFDPATGALHDNPPALLSTPAGSGPRHIDFHPNGRFAYTIEEKASTVTFYTYDASAGRLASQQVVSTLPSGFAGTNTGAEIQVAPSGRFVYGSNRGDDSIAVFAIDPTTGRLTPVAHTKTRGTTPRHFQIDPSGRFLLAANQGSDTVAVFRIDPDAGTLSAAAGDLTTVLTPGFVGVIELAAP